MLPFESDRFTLILSVISPKIIQYKEGSRADFGKLRVVHMGDLDTLETQIAIQADAIMYGMRLGWRYGAPPLTGELLSLHLPQSKMLVRVSRVQRTCVCCPRGAVYVYVDTVPGILPDTSICKCSQKRPAQVAKEWRDFSSEVDCPRKSRAVLRKVSDILNQRHGRKA